ncbi:toxin-antitoxin system YwqK family antitoxin [Aureibacter tunicatorum]|uniref:Antitoxin component YwqK of YwqJK toxin-antitoxin module n=1 Tax=Aureibacter tunicatorum TaxID=866807 RepID=A0AAE3XNF2_9BACT|nr:hypothetical protein [Aureibacter tunicatorum]MDR6239168.1 antitoxin component YwqK of YwqJK toxin-antitoxin module [Aureibacter tunicatorum]
MNKYFSNQSIKETFYVNSDGKLEGLYVSYFPNGKVKEKGFYSNNLPDSLWQYFSSNGKITKKGYFVGNQMTGHWQFYYENGELKSEGGYENGIKSHVWTYYYESGTPKSSGEYVEDLKVGRWVFYYESGTSKQEIDYSTSPMRYTEFDEQGNLVAEGELDSQREKVGQWYYYYEDRSLKGQGVYYDGKKLNEWLFFDREGYLSARAVYNEKGDASWKYYSREGNTVMEGKTINELRQGQWKLYANDGKIKGLCEYNRGTGHYKEFYPSGELKAEGTIRNEAYEGKWTYYNLDGSVEGIAVFQSGNGKYTGFYDDSTVSMEGELLNDQKIGQWKLYKRNGQMSGFYEPLEMEMIIQKVKNSGKSPAYIYKKKTKVRYFKAQKNETEHLIVSFSPISQSLDNLSLDLEFHFRERMGYELFLGYRKSPLYSDFSKMDTTDVFETGVLMGINQKFYHRHTVFGMPYFGHGINYRNITTASWTDVRKSEKFEQRRNILNYSMFVGLRWVQDSHFFLSSLSNSKRGLTLDVNVGLNVGCVWRKPMGEYSDQMLQNSLDESGTQSNFDPFFKLSVGYHF